jgi:small subunit ribosomal protein S6
MSLKHYETVFILTPVLSDAQVKDAVERFKNAITSHGGEVYHEEEWGLKKLAYNIQHKSSGFYCLLEFRSTNEKIVDVLETEFRRDERVMRFLTTALDKYALEYNEKRRRGAFNKKSETVKEEAK